MVTRQQWIRFQLKSNQLKTRSAPGIVRLAFCPLGSIFFPLKYWQIKNTCTNTLSTLSLLNILFQYISAAELEGSDHLLPSKILDSPLIYTIQNRAWFYRIIVNSNSSTILVFWCLSSFVQQSLIFISLR